MAKKEEKNIKNKTSFFKSFKAELKKVIWPTPKQLFNNTSAVLAIVLITAVIVFALDFTFESLNKHGINKIKEVVSNTTANETSNTLNESTNVDTATVDGEENEVVESTDSNVVEDNVAE